MAIARSVPAAPIERRVSRWIALAVFAGLAGSLFASSARGACGDYVKRLGPGFVPGQVATEKAAADQVAAEIMTAESHSMPASTPCPCRGPECRRAPHDHSPFHPSSPVRTTVSQELTALASRSFDLTFGDCWFIGEFSGLALRGHPLGIIRPPSI